MSNRIRPVRYFCAAAFIGATFPLAVRADISGFGDFSNFTVNQHDSSAAPTVAPGLIHITGPATLESRSIFYNTPQTISQFVTSFTFQAKGHPNGSAYGMTMVFQNSTAGLHTVAAPTILNGLGYSDALDSFNKSAAVSLEYSKLGALGSGSTSSGFYTGGSIGSGGSTSTLPVNLFSGDPINVILTYNGSILQETFLDTVTLSTFSNLFLANIPSAVGSTSAIVGFTAASDSSDTQGSQDISNFQFTGGVAPEPASLSLLASCGIPLLLRRRREI